MASVNNLDDAHERIGTAISTALKEIKPISISINWNLPSTCILVLSFFSPRANLCNLLPLRHGYTWPSFIHRFTRTNAELQTMKIPKEVASCLDIPKHGLARLRLGKESFSRTEYDTSLDGRIFFKQGWKQFLTRHDMRSTLLY